MDWRHDAFCLYRNWTSILEIDFHLWSEGSDPILLHVVFRVFRQIYRLKLASHACIILRCSNFWVKRFPVVGVCWCYWSVESAKMVKNSSTRRKILSVFTDDRKRPRDCTTIVNNSVFFFIHIINLTHKSMKNFIRFLYKKYLKKTVFSGAVFLRGGYQ